MDQATITLVAQIASPLVGAGFIAFLLQRGFKQQDRKLEKIEKRMDCFEGAQHACQLDNAKEFATKEEVRLDSGKQWERIDNLETRVSRLEGSKGAN
ncbi:MAG TPA: hypothetical protein VNT26_07350 [Candidatus Sulfotelmatobacter sp.]|nr:hypothetical protein [Candidatus Sulfotelmatobacter sp.]